MTFTKDDQNIVSTSDLSLKYWDVNNGLMIDELKDNNAIIQSLKISPGGNLLIAGTFDNSITFWDTYTRSKIAELYLLENNEWAIIAENGSFDASTNAMEMLHYVIDNEPIELTQLKERYYEPGLAELILIGESTAKLQHKEGFDMVGIYPKVNIALELEPDPIITISLDEREGGIGKVSIFFNQREIIEDIRMKGVDGNIATRYKVNIRDYQNYIIPGAKNTVGVKVFNEEGWLSSRMETVSYEAPFFVGMETDTSKKMIPINLNRTYKPHFYGIVVGTSDYKGESLDLTFSSKDAHDIAESFGAVASNLFGEDNVHIKLLSSDDKEPSKENIRLAFSDLASSRIDCTRACVLTTAICCSFDRLARSMSMKFLLFVIAACIRASRLSWSILAKTLARLMVDC